jgi:hypothetical protein
LPAIRTELEPRKREAIVAAREELLAGGPEAIAAAIERWIADEERFEERVSPAGTRIKSRSSEPAVAEHRAIVWFVAERAFADGNQLTSRGVAYVLEGLGLPKTERVFRRIGEDVLALRDSGLIGWETIADGSRRILRHGRFRDTEHALGWLAETYERVLWKDAPVQAQVWVGKAGIAEILAPHAHSLGLDVLPTRGFSGAGFIRAAVAECADDPRPIVVFIADDLDSAGLRSIEAIERRVRRDAAELGVVIEAVERFAITEEQVRRLSLPTRPQKESTHRRSDDLSWAVELDALPPAELREALSAAVDRRCPEELRTKALAAEAADRDQLAELKRLLPEP